MKFKINFETEEKHFASAVLLVYIFRTLLTSMSLGNNHEKQGYFYSVGERIKV